MPQSPPCGVSAHPGISPTRTDGTIIPDEALRPTRVANLRVVPAGAPPPDPTELLGSAGMDRLSAALELHCDVVLLDSPPVLLVKGGNLGSKSLIVTVPHSQAKK